MSLKPSVIEPVPEQTVRVARAAFPKGNLYISIRDQLGTLFEDADFSSLYPRRGQPAFAPWRLALITIMQFLENLSDRQASDAVRSRIDWKYVLSLELTDAGFDHSVLSNFRERLTVGGQSALLLDRVIEMLQEKNLLKVRGKQRTDSTHVLAAIRVMNRLELVTETMRAVLNDLASVSPIWLSSVAAPQWFARYGARLSGADERKLAKRATENPEAYQLYMKGHYHIARGTPSDLRTSISYFQQAIDIDPNYALAYTGLSQAYGVLGIAGEMPTSEAFPKARAAAQKAIEIDDTLAEAHVATCMSLFWYDWEWSAADNHCRRALELDPNSADSHQAYAQVLSNTGRHAEALAEVKRARELNPLDLAISALEGQYMLHAGLPDEALAQLQKTSELEPNFWMAHSFAASAYIEKGMYAEAIAESRKESELSGGNVIPFGTYALAKSGRRDEARAVFEELLKLSKTRYVPPYNIALICNGLEERANALEWLEKAYEQRDPKMTFLKVEPKWNNLRNEPRFIDLMQHLKL